MIKLKNKNLFRQQCYVNGKWIQADNKKTFSVNNPFDNQIIGRVPRCGKSETKKAIQAAHKAWEVWRSKTTKERADILLKWHALIAENKEDLAIIMTTEQGKPITESRGEIDYGNSFIRWFAEEARRVYGDVIASNNKEQ